MTVGEFKKDLKGNLKLPTRREKFTDTQLALVAPDEKRGVTLTGYVLRAVKQGPETANCESDTRADIHVWLYLKTSSDKAERTRLRGYAVVLKSRLAGKTATRPGLRLAWRSWPTTDQRYESRAG